MRRHHTKTKGDLGVLHAQLDLAQRGYIILLPQTEHAPFDLVAYLDGRFLRVQVKYRAAVNGVVSFPMSTSWADRHGTHTSLIDKTSIDVMCIFCPDTGRCYYVDPRSVRGRIHLRLSPTRNGQTKFVHDASDFTEIPEACGVFASASTGLVGTASIRHSRQPRAAWGLVRAHSSAG